MNISFRHVNIKINEGNHYISNTSPIHLQFISSYRIRDIVELKLSSIVLQSNSVGVISLTDYGMSAWASGVRKGRMSLKGISKVMMPEE